MVAAKDRVRASKGKIISQESSGTEAVEVGVGVIVAGGAVICGVGVESGIGVGVGGSVGLSGVAVVRESFDMVRV